MANVSDYLKPFMQTDSGKASTEGLQQFRHFRFIMREEGPALQARHMMASPFSDEGWLGLQPYTFYTYLFQSTHGVPNIWDACQTGKLPAAMMKVSEDIEGFYELSTKYFGLLQKTYARFSDKHVKSLTEVMSLYTEPEKPWPWGTRSMQFWFDGRFKSIHRGQNAQEQLCALRPADFLQINQFYLVRPPDGDAKPFWLGKLTSIDPDKDHVWLQYLEQKDEEDPITGIYTPEGGNWVRNNTHETTRCIATALHDKMKIAKSSRYAEEYKIYVNDQYKAVFWKKYFQDPGSKPEDDEIPL